MAMMTRQGTLRAFIIIGAFLAVAALAAPEPIVLREQLGRKYGPELVSYPFTAGEGECVAHSVQVSGASGPVAVQLSDIEFWPGKKDYLRSARLSFVNSALQPLSNVTYNVSAGRDKAPAVAADLQIKQDKEQVEMTTGLVGVRLLLGSHRLATPTPIEKIPCPFTGMRLGQGEWAGSSRYYGTTQVAEWSSKLTDAGPVFGRVVATYVFANSNTFAITATVIAGDSAVHFETASSADLPDAWVELKPARVPGVKQAFLPKGYGQWAKEDRTVAVTADGKTFAWLAPDSSIVNIYPEYPPTIRMTGTDRTELYQTSRDPDAWVDPVAPFTYGGAKTWGDPAIRNEGENWKRKVIKVGYESDGSVIERFTLAKGRRQWIISAGPPKVGDLLNRVKDMVLDWPEDTNHPHPHLFVNRQEIEDGWKRIEATPALSNYMSNAEGAAVVLNLLRQHAPRGAWSVVQALGNARYWHEKLGEFDVMRYATSDIANYDALVDSGLLTPAERTVYRAQMAYLGYVMADPKCWSPERGYNSGNPNMSCSYILSLGILACAIPEHPMAKAWSDRATGWMDHWLDTEVAPDGQWLPEGTHYSGTSLDTMVAYAVAAQRAGFHDFSGDARLKKVLLYKAKTFTPPDPLRGNLRGTMVFGRGPGGEHLALFGVAARFYAKSDPALSRALEWLWAQDGYRVEMGDSRLGGFDAFYEDRGLPAEQPVWGSQLFAGLDVIFRSGFATPDEGFVNILSHVKTQRNLDVWSPEVGGIANWYGHGKPLSTAFTFASGYAERHELFRNGVRLPHNWGLPGDSKTPFGYFVDVQTGQVAFLPQVDYVRSRFTNTSEDGRDWFPEAVNGKESVPAWPRVKSAKSGKLDWTRQVLYLKDVDPAGPTWLLLRDTTAGGEPTVWQFWTLSEKVGTPEQARDAGAFLAEKPGHAVRPASELPMGSRYTALGQFGVDVEYFIASPADTPRHTLRFGAMTDQRPPVPEFQDLMHLQLPGDGAYYVALFPRPRDQEPPSFTTLADGKIIKVAGKAGDDFAFLSTDEATAAAEGVSFRGTAGAVQQRNGGTVLSLAAAGEVRWSTHALAAPGPASLQVSPHRLSVWLAAAGPGGQLTVTAPGSWALKNPPAGVTLEKDAAAWRLTVPSGLTQVVLEKITP